MNGRDWRIDHNEGRCQDYWSPHMVDVKSLSNTEQTTGLIDHNTFFNMTISVYGYPSAQITDNLNGATQWTTPLAPRDGRGRVYRGQHVYIVRLQ